MHNGVLPLIDSSHTSSGACWFPIWGKISSSGACWLSAKKSVAAKISRAKKIESIKNNTGPNVLPKMFDTLKKEVDEYNQAEEEKQEKRELEKIEREKRKKSWKYELKKLLDDFGGVSPSSPSPSKTRSKGGKKKRKRYAYTRRAHRT